jgi:hypothetical protein
MPVRVSIPHGRGVIRLAGAEYSELRHLLSPRGVERLKSMLSWLRAARRSLFTGDGRVVAWIPTAVPEGEWPTLATVAARLNDTFERHHVQFESGSTPPERLDGADLAIVAAHGGVADEGRFFRVVRDDAHLEMGSSAVSSAFAKVGTVVLVVCSGGRLDKHPEANAVVGLVKQLLDDGCRAVIAPPWPLAVNVPPHWLPTFLDAWHSGEPVIDACFQANAAVQAALGPDPAACLAMTVYGDPLSSRSALAPPAPSGRARLTA